MRRVLGVIPNTSSGKFALAVFGVAAESVTRTETCAQQFPPKKTGHVPLRTPPPLSVNPWGSKFAASHFRGGVPPFAVRVVVYGTPALAPGRDVVVIVNVGDGGGCDLGGGLGELMLVFPPPHPLCEPRIKILMIETTMY